MKPPQLVPFRIWFPFGGWLILIFILSAYPKAIIPQGKYISWDKIAHLTEFGVLGYLAARAAYFSGVSVLHKYWLPLTLVFGIIYAVSDEWHQLHVPGRWASPYDVIADSVGIILGIWFFSRTCIGKKIGA